MKYYKLINRILFCLLIMWTASCSPTATEQLNSFITQTPLPESTISTPANKLQLSYIENRYNFGQFYLSDIHCLAKDDACFGEPKLLFNTIPMPSDEQLKPKGLLTEYSWSRDGNKIALVSAGDVLISDVTAQNWTNITNSPEVDEYQPKWSPNGTSIYYRACPLIVEGNYGGHSACQFYRSDLTGKVEFHLLNSRSDYYDAYDISPDDQKVIFSLTDEQGYNQIYQANLDGTDNRQITSGQMNNSAPSFSSDGKKVVFVRASKRISAAKMQSDIIVKDLTTGEEKNLTEKFGGDVFTPVFSPDDKWVAFSSFDTDLNANIFIASLDQPVLIQVTHTNQAVGPSWRLVANQ